MRDLRAEAARIHAAHCPDEGPCPCAGAACTLARVEVVRGLDDDWRALLAQTAGDVEESPDE